MICNARRAVFISWWQRTEIADRKSPFILIGGRVAETERKMSKILKSGGRVAESKVYRPKNRIGGWQTAESVSQKLKFHGSQKF